jgi:Acyl-CoA reductase (LuxC)
MQQLIAPAVIRGRVVIDGLAPFGGRGDVAEFLTPDPVKLAAALPLADPGAMADVYNLPFDEIIDYLDQLGKRLELQSNCYLQEALERSIEWSDMTPPLIRSAFAHLRSLFAADAVRELAELTIGTPYLQGWVQRRLNDGRQVAIRAVGARAVHIIAGNSPVVAGISIVRNALTRSDAIVKTPSNDPLTALAIARTMVDMAPEHPLTRHLSVAYWKGGATEVEEQLYHPALVEKIVAWGGFASVTHVTRYLQPGLELVALDPKRSATIIGAEAFRDETTLRQVASRAAADVGALNQLGCVNARVVYAVTGTDHAGLDRVNRLGQLIYDEIQRLPEAVSTKTKRFDPELRANIDALRSSPDWYRVIGGRDGEGAVVVSQLSEPVEFHRSLSGRVANLVPVGDPLDVLPAVNSYTQTVGVYPESLKTVLRDVLPHYGAQRLVSLGYACVAHTSLPQDAIEPVRRIVKWIVDDQCDPAEIAPVWASPTESEPLNA